MLNKLEFSLYRTIWAWQVRLRKPRCPVGAIPLYSPQRNNTKPHAPVRKPSTAEFGERGGVPVTTLPLEHSGSTGGKHKLTQGASRARWAQRGRRWPGWPLARKGRWLPRRPPRRGSWHSGPRKGSSWQTSLRRDGLLGQPGTQDRTGGGKLQRAPFCFLRLPVTKGPPEMEQNQRPSPWPAS